jgi:CCR4-NOT transcription complex subunit 9
MHVITMFFLFVCVYVCMYLKREVVLLELSKKRESFADLAPILWHSQGTVAALLIEIVSIYPHLTPPTLTAHASNRVCNALALLQCVASHSDTRQPFLAANMQVLYKLHL